MYRMPFSRCFLLLLLVCGGAGIPSVKGGLPDSEPAGKPVIQFYPVQSGKLPLVFRSPEAIYNPSRLAVCEKALSQIMFHLGLNRWENTRFVVSWNDYSPNSLWVDTFPRSVNRDKQGWVFTIKGQGNWETGKEQLFRTLSICLLQSCMLPKSGVLWDPTLPEPPLWLSEGLTQILMESRKEAYASAVWRFSLAQKVPSLEAIQEWGELSEDGIRRSWQQTFSFWLGTQATRTTADKTALQGYLVTLLAEPGKKYWPSEATHEDWWQRSTTQSLKQVMPGYDWGQSVARLRECTFLSVKYKGEEEARLISITELPRSTQSLQGLQPVDEAWQKLTELSLRCHPLIRPVVVCYRNALEAWVKGNIDDYAKNLRAARDQQKETTLLREKANDFLDWFTVNYEIDMDHSDYRNYAQRVEEFETLRKDLRRQELEKTTAR